VIVLVVIAISVDENKNSGTLLKKLSGAGDTRHLRRCGDTVRVRSTDQLISRALHFDTYMIPRSEGR